VKITDLGTVLIIEHHRMGVHEIARSVTETYIVGALSVMVAHVIAATMIMTTEKVFAVIMAQVIVVALIGARVTVTIVFMALVIVVFRVRFEIGFF